MVFLFPFYAFCCLEEITRKFFMSFGKRKCLDLCIEGRLLICVTTGQMLLQDTQVYEFLSDILKISSEGFERKAGS